jgi:hypothetical protein
VKIPEDFVNKLGKRLIDTIMESVRNDLKPEEVTLNVDKVAANFIADKVQKGYPLDGMIQCYRTAWKLMMVVFEGVLNENTKIPQSYKHN